MAATEPTERDRVLNLLLNEAPPKDFLQRLAAILLRPATEPQLRRAVGLLGEHGKDLKKRT